MASDSGSHETAAARMTSPEIQADSSDAKNTAGGGISVTRPSRPSGVFQPEGRRHHPPRYPRPRCLGICMTGSDGVDAYLAQCQFERQSSGISVSMGPPVVQRISFVARSRASRHRWRRRLPQRA
jgi:hypothetical protein